MKGVVVFLLIILSVAYVTLCERKLLGHQQRRLGPNQVGVWGSLQPFADAFKLVLKETVWNVSTNRGWFIIAPWLTLTLAFLNWWLLPLGPNVVMIDFNLGLLWWMAMGGLEIFGILLTGWSANTKYTLLGSLRATSQMISYELPYAFALLSVAWLWRSLDPKIWMMGVTPAAFSLWPFAFILSITMLAETNRAPFDLPEAESELVSGFMTEHAAITFTFLFLAEYTNMVWMASVINLLLWGNAWPFSLYFYIWIRAVLPRLRFDLLLRLGWGYLLPIAIGIVAILPATIVWI